jgi:hypothetical protein
VLEANGYKKHTPRTEHQLKTCVWENAPWLLNLKDNIRTSMKALCLGECYMDVELKRQHQNINESLVFGRMLWLLNLKDNIRTSMKALCLGECYGC